jgi:hypothetical protein
MRLVMRTLTTLKKTSVSMTMTMRTTTTSKKRKKRKKKFAEPARKRLVTKWQHKGAAIA